MNFTSVLENFTLDPHSDYSLGFVCGALIVSASHLLMSLLCSSPTRVERNEEEEEDEDEDDEGSYEEGSYESDEEDMSHSYEEGEVRSYDEEGDETRIRDSTSVLSHSSGHYSPGPVERADGSESFSTYIRNLGQSLHIPQAKPESPSHFTATRSLD